MSTNDELKELMRTHGLRIKDVAAMLETTESTVKSWRAAPEKVRHRNMPRALLKLLKMQLEK